MKHLISLFLFLLLNNRIEASTTTTAAAETATTDNKSTPPEIENLPLKNFQKVVTKCEAVREIFDHEGGAAGFTSDCVIKVWNDKTSPSDLKDLTSEQQEKLKTELSGKTQSSQDEQFNLDHVKMLQEEAANRHYMCMEAKRSILYQLKLQLPAGLNSCDKINQVLNDLKLSPLLEGFINKVSGPMKEIVARIHAIEQDTTMAEADKLEALRKEKSQLTRLLDEDCKDDHPSIRFHNIGYLPSPDLQQLKMTLVVTHPDRKVEFFNLPAEGMGPHVEHLRSIAHAAAHHFQVTGLSGPFKAHLMSAPRSEGGFASSAPGVISFVPAEKAAYNTSSSSGSTVDEAIKNIFKKKPAENISAPLSQAENIQQVPVVDLNTPTSDITTDTQTQPTVTLSEIKSPLAKYWQAVLKAHESFVINTKYLAETSNVSTEIGKKNFDFQAKNEKEALDAALTVATLALLKEANLDVISEPVTSKKIEKRYQDSKALLENARAYMPAEKRSFMDYFTSKEKPFAMRVYDFGIELINNLRKDDLLKLKAGNIVPVAVNTVDNKDNDTTGNSDATNSGNIDTNPTSSTPPATAKKPIDPKIAKKEELISEFVKNVSDPVKTITLDELKEQFKILFDEQTLQEIPNVTAYKHGYSTSSKERKLLLDNKAKMVDLLTQVLKLLKAIKEFKQSDLVKQVGTDFINQYIASKSLELQLAENGTTKALESRKVDIDNFVAQVSALTNINDILTIKTYFDPLFNDQNVDSMPTVPFNKGYNIFQSAYDIKLKEREAKRTILLAEVVRQLKANGFTGVDTVKAVGEEYILELAKPKKQPPSNNNSNVGSFWSRLTS